jgi:two-component system sensor histidine kinase HydH
VLRTLIDLFGSNASSQTHARLKWLMLARVVFAALVLVATFFLQTQHTESKLDPFFLFSYLIVAAIFIVSLAYVFLFSAIQSIVSFGSIQIAVDSVFVSFIVLLTGGYFSLFSFLYLLVIICASMILYLRGGLVLALLSSIEYAAILFLQYHSILPSISSRYFDFGPASLPQIIYKILITSAAAFAMALLSGLLTEQNRKTHKELKAMESHVKRVEKMAYMGEMAAGLAHEIKNPLASLVGSIQLLKEESAYDPGHQRLMDIILRETDRLGTLVNDFLFFARPPAGKPEKLNLKAAIEDIVALFEKDITHSKKCILRKNLSDDCWMVMDPTHLRQILWNLLLNAAEAIADNGLIEIKTFKAKNNDICIQVTDNGCGIPADVVQSIFDPFYTTKSEGTGLGLSIVHRIIEAYDGRLDVNTKEGEGTSFSLMIKQSTSSY